MAEHDLYQDPSLYDLEYAHQDDDVVYYVEQALAGNGPVLELGCGNGRITLPLARAGVHVHGVDRAPGMLADLARKVRAEDPEVARRIRWSEGDFTALEVRGVYDRIFLPFNAIHHCRSHRDVLALLDGVRTRLRPKGRFLLDLYLPDPSLYARDPNVRYEPRDFIDPSTGGPLRSWESGWYDPMTQTHHVRYIYRDHTGHERTVALDLRMFYPQELRALLDWGGFDIVREAEDFSGKVLGGTSLKWVLELAPR